MNLFHCICDLIVIPLGIICTLAPTRMGAMIYIWCKFIYQSLTTLPCCWPKGDRAKSHQAQQNIDSNRLNIDPDGNGGDNDDEREQKYDKEEQEIIDLKSEIFIMIYL